LKLSRFHAFQNRVSIEDPTYQGASTERIKRENIWVFCKPKRTTGKKKKIGKFCTANKYADLFEKVKINPSSQDRTGPTD
jgi:hypothetical protein